MTKHEKILWKALRAKRFLGYKFRRQVPIGPFIADFYCSSAKLIVELDGGEHAERSDYDCQRDTYLRAHGSTVLRFWNGEVTTNLEGVLEMIIAIVSADRRTLSPQGEGVCLPLP
jgi:very-short-patch-repair endonuclease